MNQYQIIQAELKQDGIILSFYNDQYNECLPDVATQYTLVSFDPFYIHTFKMVKKFSISLVMDRLNKKLNYNSIDWRKIFKPLQLSNIGFYTTSYGIGVEVIFGSRRETINKIETYLTGLGIEYTNEYSDARWVYRFNISKSAANIERINNINL